MEILKTPWKDNLLDLVAKSRNSIKITSPFIKENICDAVLAAKQADAKLEFVTSFKLMSVYAGSIDLPAIEKIIDANGSIKNHSKLHAKIYLFDNKKVIITSGNLTNGGLLNNFEYGIYIDEIKIVSQVISDFELLSKHKNTGEINKSDVVTVREILSKVPKVPKIALPAYDIKSPEENFDILELPDLAISSTLKGWQLDVFNCVNSVNKQIFNLDDIYKFQHQLKQKHKTNNNIQAKIRQMLQQLRDIGLIEFLGNGEYKKLWI